MPLRGAKTQRVFIPLWNLSPVLAGNQRQAGTPYGGCAFSADCPAGGENPQGFHPFFSHSFVEPIPNSGRESAGGGHVMRWLCFPGLPCRGRKPAGFSSLL
ncbi:MAG: hypothetical protein LBK61_08535 [Spirochaetaceae bacterium]|nr:hypothetical protein [Spirochaetaceae bacterium]